MRTFERLAELSLQIDSYELGGLRSDVSSAFTRHTTGVRLLGSGESGVGEDVTYGEAEQLALQAAGPQLPLAGKHTLGSFGELMGRLQLFPDEPQMDAFRFYRRWAFESAALDLALRQTGRSLAEALGREPGAIRFVVSLRLGEPPSLDPVRRLLASDPGLELKVDPTSSWSEDLIADLVSTQAVVAVDLKGAYRGTVVDQPADPVLYRRVVSAFPDAWIEDPALTPETEPILLPESERITWDAPIHGVGDIEALPFMPRMLNVKPSRFGSLESLFDAYDYCADNGIETYGGGQFELGPRRGQIQYLASLFSPESPNDVAPSAFNTAQPGPDLPRSPLPAPSPDEPGFRYG